MDEQWYAEDITYTYIGFCISRTIAETELTGRTTVMTNYGEHEAYLKFYRLTFQNCSTLPNIWK